MNRLKILNSFHLKIIALVAMILDHIGYIFFTEFVSFRIIGRISFILYAFMLVEGFFQTKNLNKYILKLIVWAIISEIPFDLALHNKIINWEYQNIYFSLLISLIGMKFKSQIKNDIGKILVMILSLILAVILKVDYSWYGVLIIFIFYYCRNLKSIQLFSVQFINIIAALNYFKVQFFGFLAFLPILMYNGKKGTKIGDMYYSFYALHLSIFAIIKFYLVK